MKFKNFLILVPVGLALTACGSSSTSSDTSSAAAANPNSGLAGTSSVTNPPGGATGSTGSTGTTTGSSGSSGSPTVVNGCPVYPQHALYSYPGMTGTGSGRATYLSQSSTPSEIIADSKLRVSIIPGGANGTVGTGGTAHYSYLSADVHLLANGVEIDKKTVAGAGHQAPNGYTYESGIALGKNSDPALADFSNDIIGRAQGTTYAVYVDNIKTDYKCGQFATFAYYQTMGDCLYYYNPYSPAQSLCSYNWNWDYHQWNWACCVTNMLEQAQKLQCGTGTPLANATYSLTVQVETDSTPCITGF